MSHIEYGLIFFTLAASSLNLYLHLKSAKNIIQTISVDIVAAHAKLMTDARNEYESIRTRAVALEAILLTPAPSVVSQPVSSSAAAAQTVTDPVVSPQAV